NPATVFSIPTGVDVCRFRPSLSNEKLKEALGFERKQRLVGTVTFLRPEKGTHILIEAMGLLRNEFPLLRCLIIGSGPEQRKLVQQIRDRSLESVVVLAGFRQDIPDLLNLLEVFVLPSLEEGMPQSLTQALAMECPVVASAVGAVPEVVKDQETGLLVPAVNPRILSEKIAYLLREPSQGKRMGKAGRRVVESSFSLEEMLKKTEQVYSHLWETRGRPAA
ncbi:MAG: glycosyltransferase, partial [Nitrospirales bacterium]|nr:glycosyltransferase [Nitrospirales bacterium]